MKTKASLKKRTPDCVIVRRKGRLFVINKKNPKFTLRPGYKLLKVKKSIPNVKLFWCVSKSLYLCNSEFLNIR